MRLILCTILLIVAVVFFAGAASHSWAADYDQRFMRSYPPGYYGMWYYAERFYEKKVDEQPPEESYRWDKFMSKMTNLTFPFLPIPYSWDYGTYRGFNLPEYNRNDWW